MNALLQGADPIIQGFQNHRLTDAQAAARMGALELRFADFTVDVNALQPSDPALAAINAPYAHTFIFEDSYLNALVSGMADDNVSNLPNPQSDHKPRSSSGECGSRSSDGSWVWLSPSTSSRRAGVRSRLP